MLNFIKKIRPATYISIAVIILTIVSLVLYTENSNLAYFRNLNSLVTAFSIVAMVLCLAGAVLGNIFGNKFFLIVPQVAVGVLLTIALVNSIVDRSSAMGYVWFSDLESNNVDAVFALNNSITFWITYFIAIVGSITLSFFNYVKEEK